MSKSLVILSGGQDSTTCLYWAIRKFGGPQNVETLTFDYGQRHRIELNAAATVASHAGVVNKVLPVNTFNALGGDALTDRGIKVGASKDVASDLPNTFVPGRNLIFITYAASYAYHKGIHDLVTGVSQTDYSGYPDCREQTMRSLEKTVELGMEYPIRIHTPLIGKTKAESVLLAKEMGALDVLMWTHTCYNGKYPPCGDCDACKLRAKGFEEAGLRDPIFRRP